MRAASERLHCLEADAETQTALQQLSSQDPAWLEFKLGSNPKR